MLCLCCFSVCKVSMVLLRGTETAWSPPRQSTELRVKQQPDDVSSSPLSSTSQQALQLHACYFKFPVQSEVCSSACYIGPLICLSRCFPGLL
ncbi:hypothetical protein AV530_006045 [Patagioenas fasciata monilis]|uniref:Secreted protein n=1 Tax=Patagioenas fasciata monilis TaxID=372326 RepID=A0A1V4J823_PATFA|nr:hypothetical protein AV530_006045 [Patagioenas fasciata monilis]